MYPTLFILHTQNAWRTKRPEEMVKVIGLGFPAGMDVENPVEDADFMAQIGAKQRPIGAFEKPESWKEYVLTNNVTAEAKFAFAWFPAVDVCAYTKNSLASKNDGLFQDNYNNRRNHWRIRRME